MKKNLELLTIILLFLSGVANGKSFPCTPPVKGAIVGPNSICLGAAITYHDPTGTAGGFWSTSNTAIAIINAGTGSLTAVGTGTVTVSYAITTGCGSTTATFSLTVSNSASLIKGGDSVCNGFPLTLSDTVFGGTWSSGTMGVASIGSNTGAITTSANGVTVITYNNGTCSASINFTVNPIPSAITGTVTAVCKGDSVQLTDPTPGGVWSSTTPSIAPVDSFTGYVTGAVAGGATDIYYTLPTGCTVATPYFLSVNQPPLAITGPTSVCVGEAVILVENVFGGTWSTSASGIVSGYTGTFTTLGNEVDTLIGLMPGNVNIYYATPSCPPDTVHFTVKPLPSPILGPTAVCLGMTTYLVDTTLGGRWSSDNTLVSVVAVDSAGAVTSSDTGITAVITYTGPNTCVTTATVFANRAPHPITGSTTICQGANTTLADTDAGGIWSSTNLAIASVIDSTGKVTGISAGNVNISYTFPSGCFQETSFTVEPPVTPGVTIANLDSGILCAGDTDTLVATPINSGPTPTYQWSIFSVPVPGATSDTFIYVPSHADAVNCTVLASGVCALNYYGIDTSFVNVAIDSVVPSVSITISGGDTISHLGETVNFYSAVTNGGSAPTYQWYKNDTAISGATNSTYSTTIYANDTFFCAVTGNPLCPAATPLVGFSNPVYIYDRLGIRSLSANGSIFSLFPNPNNGSFTLTGTLATVTNDDLNYEVSNILGQLLYSGKTTPVNGRVNALINPGNLVNGAYLLRISANNETETLQFVVNK